MNNATQQVIEFLSYPELRFGSEEDILLFSDPNALRTRVATLLAEPQPFLSTEEADALQSHLAEADWPLIAQEFATRVNMTARFFDPDAEASKE